MFKNSHFIEESPTKSLYLSNFNKEKDFNIEGLWKEKYEVSERNYQSLEVNYKEVLSENTKLAEIVHNLTREINTFKSKNTFSDEYMRINEELRKDNEFLAKSCNNLKKSLDEYRKKPEKSIIYEENAFKNQIELQAIIVLLKSENDRLHIVCEDLSEEIHMKNTRFSSNNSNQFQESRISNNSEVFTQFNDQISVHNELMAWKGRFYEIERNFLTMNKDFNENKEKMAMIIRENEVLKVNSREKDEEIKRIMGELRESQKFALMFPEMNENMQRLLQENERLKSVILNRCRDLTRETWSF